MSAARDFEPREDPSVELADNEALDRAETLRWKRERDDDEWLNGSAADYQPQGLPR